MAGDVVLNEEGVRRFVGRLGGVCQVLDGVPEFLAGANDEGQTVWLTREDLGDYEPFHAAWSEICDNRLKEIKDLAAFLRDNRKKLVKAAEEITRTDMDSAALFPHADAPGGAEGATLEGTVERHGIDVRTHEEATVDRLGRNVPE